MQSTIADEFSPVFQIRDIREIEARATGAPSLMARAGLEAAQFARDRIAAVRGRILILAGPGNNGGDAFVAARHLKSWWFEVTVVFTGNASTLPDDSRGAYDAWIAAEGSVVSELPPRGQWELIIDGLFGIGLNRAPDARHASLIDSINALGTPVMALDIPSGLMADTGNVPGNAIRATHTLTFIGLKPGLLTMHGPDLCGEVHVCTLGLPDADLLAKSGWMIEPGLLRHVLRARPRNSHKGMFGNIGIIGGDSGMLGAALLAGRAALKLGGGRVYVGIVGADAISVDYLQPELMLREARDVVRMDDLSALVIGPGLGQSSNARALLNSSLKHACPVVLDADALNLLSADEFATRLTTKREGNTILTPHPAEAARLLQLSTAQIQTDRVSAAQALATRFQAATVLKGAGSICASRDGNWYVNNSGNPGMAAAGMGDVLAGMIGAFLGQGATISGALLGGTHLHGLAADALVQQHKGPVGLTASEVIDSARDILNRAMAS
jgi:ADP-dependent NAD(P)H-hydrate dehydratase / NAD(P)H-hydrate epimerase